VIKSLVVGRYQPLADDRGEATVRPNLSLAVASKDKEKLLGQFFFTLFTANPALLYPPAFAALPSGGQLASSATRNTRRPYVITTMTRIECDENLFCQKPI
jgi:hypothetical protein